jgi:hypothetical protein
MRFEARSEIHRVPDAGVGRALVGARVARHHDARRDADADLDLRLAGGIAIQVEEVDRLEHLERGPHGAVAGSGCGTGAPKMAISPSAAISVTMPPWALIASNISV